MNNPECNAHDEVISRIDADQLHVMSHAVARALIDHIPYSGEDRILIEAFDEDMLDAREWIRRDLWKRIEELPPGNGGSLWLLRLLMIQNHAVDWELAEYMIEWSRQAGVSEQAICKAFGVDV